MPFELLDENDQSIYDVAEAELEAQYERILESVENGTAFNWEKETEIMTAAFLPVILATLMSGVDASLSSLQTSVVIEPSILDSIITSTQAQAQDFASNYAFNLVKDINDNTAAQLQDIFSQAIAEGWDLDQIKAALEPLFGEYRASLIAVTESTRAYNEGVSRTTQNLIDLGYNAEDYWYTVNDNRVCETCEPNHGRARSLWSVDNTVNPPKNTHVGCRCHVETIIYD